MLIFNFDGIVFVFFFLQQEILIVDVAFANGTFHVPFFLSHRRFFLIVLSFVKLYKKHRSYYSPFKCQMGEI